LRPELNYAPMAFVPLIIRWGPDASSDRLRQAARCTRCGGEGATLMHPSYVDRIVGFQPFPARPSRLLRDIASDFGTPAVDFRVL